MPEPLLPYRIVNLSNGEVAAWPDLAADLQFLQFIYRRAPVVRCPAAYRTGRHCRIIDDVVWHRFAAFNGGEEVCRFLAPGTCLRAKPGRREVRQYYYFRNFTCTASKWDLGAHGIIRAARRQLRERFRDYERDDETGGEFLLEPPAGLMSAAAGTLWNNLDEDDLMPWLQVETDAVGRPRWRIIDV